MLVKLRLETSPQLPGGPGPGLRGRHQDRLARLGTGIINLKFELTQAGSGTSEARRV